MILLQLTFLSVLFWAVRVYAQLDGHFLPENVEPIRYTMTFEVLNSTNFRGKVSIDLKVVNDTRNITLHADNLLIDEDSIQVVDSNGDLIEHDHSIVDEEKDFYIIRLKGALHKGKPYKVTINNFVGSLTNHKHGFYRGYYYDSTKTQKYFAVTHLEPTFARKAFPCFDEPKFKATYIINLIRPSNEVSASNMPLRETINLGNDRFQDSYEESPLMSTYTVAFIISDYKYTQPNGIIRIFAQPEYVERGSFNYSLKESCVILETIEDYIGMKYALPKLDFVSIDNTQFNPGAMENYGMITFKEWYLLVSNNTRLSKLQNSYMGVTHEIVHQWFGNLVTPRSWHYLWLNEGFATYLQYVIVQQIKPEWRLDIHFVLKKLYRSFGAKDESVNFVFETKDSQPNPSVSYSRAASIIRLTSHFLTEKVFHKALHLYIKNNQFKSTVPEDLYDAYEEALKDAPRESLLGNLSVHGILSTWNNIPNYPILTVTRNYVTGSVTFTQENADENINSIWYIPITYVFENDNDVDFNNTVSNFWLTAKSATVYPNVTDGWLLVNKMVVGPYRVNYDRSNWQRLHNFLETEEYNRIPLVNWIQLFKDNCYFADHMKLDNQMHFDLMNHLSQEPDSWDQRRIKLLRCPVFYDPSKRKVPSPAENV